MRYPLYVAFLWHMHQPYYKDPLTGIYRLPWVRLHGVKDYFDMAANLEEYPEIRQTFNLVPSLLEQLIDYTDHNARDTFLEVTRKRAGDLTGEDRAFILENFFLANWDTMIKPFPRYYELLSKRGFTYSKNDLHRIARYFSEGEFRDLQVFFNLVWIDPVLRKRDRFLTGLMEKGKEYTEEEKDILVDKQFAILRNIIPKYRELSAKGRIELSASPFYHPILPLLWDTNTAKAPTPGIRLPKKRFSFPEDARAQLKTALDYFEKVFGARPAGMWPSEGSVSEDIAKAVRSEGIQWMASDEDVLSSSIGEGLRGPSGNITRPSSLYSAYDYSGLSMIFRDHRISDLIGFTYSGWEPKSAADDLMGKLGHIYDSLPHDEPHIVPIILDGENAWEYYRNDGYDFFCHLYDALSKNRNMKTTTVSGYLNEHRATKKLSRLHAGSWINANFNVWIGHEEDNTAWDYLTETREALEEFLKENPGKRADIDWKSVYVAEGSDWNWWYGDEHSTENAKEFDELFRLNLMKVYKDMGKEIPPHLYVPVLREDRAVAPSMQIRGFIHPKIDGFMTSYFEWYQGAYVDVAKSGGSMHMTEGLISRIYYGFDRENLFVRVDPRRPFSEFPKDAVVSVEIVRPSQFRLDILLRDNAAARLLRGDDSGWAIARESPDFAIADILECAVSFLDINAKEHDEIDFFVSVGRGEEKIERCPWRGYISVSVPTAEFESTMWY